VLSPARRAADLDVVAGGRVDVAVVGGGVTGAGVALDAAARGLSVVLLERTDLAAGTSRWSSKLVHGGLRTCCDGTDRSSPSSAAS
jgi:glycerol-3-phosphate dehydrogenase